MSDAKEAYFRAAKRQSRLLPLVRRIESDILEDMAHQGYGTGQMKAALLGHSRYPALADSKEEAAAYLDGILPKDAGAGDMRLVNPQVVFEQGYERAVAKIEPQLKEADKKAFEAMEERGIVQDEIRNAYFGSSIYGDLEPHPVRRAAFERSVWQEQRTRRRQIMEDEYDEGREAFDEIFPETMETEARIAPLAVVEGSRVTRFLLRGFHEETAARLLFENTAYSGTNKAAYAEKIAAAAAEEAAAWRRIVEAPVIEVVQNDTEAYGAYLKGMCTVLGVQMLSFEQEAMAAQDLAAHAEDDLSELKAGILAHSPVIHAAGRDEARTIEALIEGKDEASTYMTDECIEELIKEAVREPKAQQAEEKQEEPAVVWEGEEKSSAPAERERRIATTSREILAEKKKLKGYAFTGEKVRTREGTFAEEMYEACREQIENDIALPFGQQMDETIIQHMFAVGYEEREIEDTLNTRSPLRMKQKAYAKNIMKYVKEKPAVKDLLKGLVQNTVAKAETKYLQNKLERHEPLSRYEEERARVRDPIT